MLYRLDIGKNRRSAGICTGVRVAAEEAGQWLLRFPVLVPVFGGDVRS
jgi:hypothetical protein